MAILLTILKLDYYRMRAWFAQHATSKLFVLMCFLVLMSVITLGLGLLSLVFFYNLSNIETYGVLTAAYVFNVAIVVTFVLALASVMVTSIAWYTSQSVEQDQLLSWGLPAHVLSLLFMVRQTVSTLFLLSLFIVPIVFGYGYHISQNQWLSLTLHTLLIIGVIGLLAQSLGNIVASGIRHLVYTQGTALSISFIGFSTLGMLYGLVQILLPDALRQLYFSPVEDFIPIYNSLPLNHSLLPSYWLSQSLVNNINIVSWIFLSGAILLWILVTLRMSLRYLKYYQHAHSQRIHQNSSDYHHPMKILVHPLLAYRWHNIARNPHELGYAGFLLALASLFFMLLSQAQGLQELDAQWTEELTVFVLGWLLFFTTAYSLRLLFPLATHLKQEAWLLMTTRRGTFEIWLSYSLVAIAVSFPLILIGLLSWQLLPLSAHLMVLGSIVTVTSMLVLVLSITYLGLINPDFELVHNPEKASTSGMGIVSLAVAVLITTLVCIAFYVYLQGIASWLIWVGTIIVIIPILLLISALARHSLYQMEY